MDLHLLAVLQRDRPATRTSASPLQLPPTRCRSPVEVNSGQQQADEERDCTRHHERPHAQTARVWRPTPTLASPVGRSGRKEGHGAWREKHKVMNRSLGSLG